TCARYRRASKRATSFASSSVSSSERPCAGFTLIELVIVITIIAVMAGMVMLSMNLFSPTRVIKTEAERLNALVRLLQDESILAGHEYGLIVYQNGLRVLEWYEPTAEEQTKYQESINKGPNAAQPRQDGTLTQSGTASFGENDELPVLPGYWRPIQNRGFKTAHLYSDQIEVLAWVDGVELELALLEDDDELFVQLEELEADLDSEETVNAKLLKMQLEAAQVRPTLLFLSSGEAVVFRVRLTWRDNPDLRFEISSDIMGNITYLRAGDESLE
ncbi:MAG: prepilin-type N-terminal cleavage/methylation domain-containing protein, partial [Gammaproteobacteria bacterium]